MAQYVILINWTDQGVRTATETVQRADQVKQMIQQQGGNMHTLLWTQGRYDLIGIVEAPDDETIAAIALRNASFGATRTETLRAFTADEMGAILQRLG